MTIWSIWVILFHHNASLFQLSLCVRVRAARRMWQRDGCTCPSSTERRPSLHHCSLQLWALATQARRRSSSVLSRASLAHGSPLHSARSPSSLVCRLITYFTYYLFPYLPRLFLRCFYYFFLLLLFDAFITSFYCFFYMLLLLLFTASFICFYYFFFTASFIYYCFFYFS